MKFSTAVFGLVASLVTKFSVADVSKAQIIVDCKGFDYHSLSESEKHFAGTTLMVTYNMVHMVADDGDFTLYEITPDESFVTSDTEVKGENLQRFDEGWVYTGGASCRLCPDDDGSDDAYSWYKPSKKPICWYFPCPLEGGEGATPVDKKHENHGKHETHGKVHRVWENTFTKALLEGPFPVFTDAEKCKIDLIFIPLDNVVDTTEERFADKVFLRASAMN